MEERKFFPRIRKLLHVFNVDIFLFPQVLDGHNGSSAARYVKENLMNDVLSALPATSSRDEWLASLPRALVAGFVKTDKDFQKRGCYANIAILVFGEKLQNNPQFSFICSSAPCQYQS